MKPVVGMVVNVVSLCFLLDYLSFSFITMEGLFIFKLNRLGWLGECHHTQILGRDI